MTMRKRTVLGSLDNLPRWTMKDTVSLQIPQSGPLLLHKLVDGQGLIACIPLEGIFLSLPARNFKCLFRERQAMVVTVKPGQGADMKPAVYPYPVPDHLYKCFDLAQRFLETCHKRSQGHAPPRTQSPPLFTAFLAVASSEQRDQCSIWSDVYEIDGIRVDQSRKTVTIVDDVLFSSAATKTAKREWPIEALDLLDINSSTRSRINRALSFGTQVDKERRRPRATMPTDEVLLVTGRVALNGLGWALRLGERPSQDERQHSPRFLVLFRDAEELSVDRRTNTIVYQNKVYQTSSIGVDHPLSSRLALADELISLFS